MKTYRVVWGIDLAAESPAQAAVMALTIQRDRNSIATVFDVVPQCTCGEFHDEEAKTFDLGDETFGVGNAVN